MSNVLPFDRQGGKGNTGGSESEPAQQKPLSAAEFAKQMLVHLRRLPEDHPLRRRKGTQ